MKIASIVGARPQFIKASVVSKAIRELAESLIEEVLIHTGQHYDAEMSAVFFEELEIPAPAYNLEVGSSSHGKQVGEMLIGLDEVLSQELPDAVLVYGDTNTTLAGALSAAKLKIPLAHVEAGLRSRDRSMPEEINRILVDHVSNFLFCPTKTAVENLKQEGIVKSAHLVGDVMLDAALYYAKSAEKRSEILSAWNLESKNYLLATIHRASNTDDLHNLRRILKAFGKLGDTVVFPVHPRTRHAIERLKPSVLSLEHIRMIPPVSYLDMLQLERNARMILTDSGGVQKEAYFFRVPCITLRNTTEWVETVAGGWNILVGTDENAILKSVKEFRPDDEQQEIFGDGTAAKKIVELLMGGSTGKK